MTRRTATRTVIFTRRFRLSGVDAAQAPDSHVIEAGEAVALSSIARRRTAIMIPIRRNGTVQVFNVDPAELNDCLRRDGDAAGATQ